jgi:AcrR family transcriptional regulator
MTKQQRVRRAQAGRPPSETAASHAAIMDAVYQLLKEQPARKLTMEAVAARAGVGKPTLYKWWPSKAALIMAMFHERFGAAPEPARALPAEEVLRAAIRQLIKGFNGQFGKVMADLIAEGQGNPTVLRELYDSHISRRRAAAVAEIERGKVAGEFAADVNAGLLIDSIVAPVYLRLLLGQLPIPQELGTELIDQALRAARPARSQSGPQAAHS